MANENSEKHVKSNEKFMQIPKKKYWLCLEHFLQSQIE